VLLEPRAVASMDKNAHVVVKSLLASLLELPKFALLELTTKALSFCTLVELK